MSLPNTGSVTVDVVEYGTRFTHRRSVSQAPDTAPATPSARRTAKPAITQVPIGTRSGTSSPSNVSVMPPVDGRPPGAPKEPNDPVARCRALRSACRWASARRPATARSRPGRSGSGGGTSRPAMSRLPSRTISAMTPAAMNRPACAPSRVQNTLSKPTLLVPDRVGPQVDARGGEDQQRDDRDDADDEPGAAHHRAERRRAGRRRPGRRRGAGKACSGAGSLPCGGAGVERSPMGVGSVGPAASPASSVESAPSCAASSPSSAASRLGLVVVVRGTLAVARRLVRVVVGEAAFRLGAPALELAHELVEEVAHRARV